MKKAQGLSMNVIIIAAISLLVLVIISVLVLRAGNTTAEGTGCEGVQGSCVDAVNCPTGFSKDVVHQCTGEKKDYLCCIPELG